MNTIGGKTFKNICVSGANALDNAKEEINSLNVFPVPDGDTGINMSLTLSGIATVDNSDNIADISKQIANSVLRNARGNSGAILALFFRGFSKAFAEAEEATNELLVNAFRRGTDEAYKAVMNPTEGTILTVMRYCAEAAEANAYEGVIAFFDGMLAAAEDALAKTPEMLPVLKQANVVDAGGAGFVTVLKGLCSALHGEPVVKNDTTSGKTNSSADFSEFNTEDIKFGYCTECIVDKSEEFVGEGSAKELYEFIITLGDSAVFIDDESVIKLHVHTNNPGLVLEKALTFGSLATVKIENMKNQHTNLTGEEKKTEEVKVEEPTAPAEPEKPYGFVSVCIGDGIESVFRDLGADSIVKGGQTMNPSTQDIVTAINEVNAENVFILPNNKNIDMVAKQAAEIVNDKNVIVLSTKTVPQGISAMMAFDPEASVEDNTEMMIEAFGAVKTLSVTYAVRDALINNVSITKGQALGLVDGKIRMVSDSSNDCIKRLADYMRNAAYITVFYGEGVPLKKAEKLQKMIERIATEAEVMLVDGGQPLYDYIVSVE
ncbi:MAG: DAK2 domain-containing protein [Clostridia bacterium]|nr:DAK2 domain-containing protein [Clostridia bacterium]